MKKVVVLILSALVVSIFVACAGLNLNSTNSAKKAPSSTLTFGYSAYVSQTGRNTKVELETLSFDFYKDRRELVREVYNRCSNPSAKFKEFLANGYDTIYLMNEQVGWILKCQYKDGKFNYVDTGNQSLRVLFAMHGRLPEFVMNSDIDEQIEIFANDKESEFIRSYLNLYDIFLAEQAAKGNKNAPTQTIQLIFGEETINPSTGKRGIEQRHTLDFDVYKGRRELVKAVYKACSNPSEKMKEYINYELRPKLIGENRERQESTKISVWYDTKGNGFKEIEKLQCKFVKLGLSKIGDVALAEYDEIKKETVSLTNMAGTLLNVDFLKSKGNISDSTLNQIVDDVISDLFNYEFVQLFDTAKRIGAAK